jgi:lipoprotein-releasing system permease protein
MALVIALALMTGVQGELRDRIVGATAHVYVNRADGEAFADPETLRRRVLISGVAAAAPAVLGQGMLIVNGISSPAMLKGIDPAREPEVTEIGSSIMSGSLSELAHPPERSNGVAYPGVLLGVDLARTLHVGEGDIVDVFTPDLQSTVGGLQPHMRPMQVVGTFRFGFDEIDSGQVLMMLSDAEQMLGRNGVDMLQLRLTKLDDAPAIRTSLEKTLGPEFLIKDWTELNAPLYSALWLEKVAISLTIGLIVMVAALNIVASLVLLVMEKSRDIAILRTMGASTAVIRRIFVYQGLTIGLVGTGTGAILGLVVSIVADKYRLISLPGSVYQITYLPFRVQPFDFAVVVLSAIGVCLAATLYPSRQAGRVDPAEALRNQ